ncbi:MAG: tetratricopeptide repeat protein [Candidatus Gastranaerophilales bacterium]|nr:tetratricopeptide repeat protein [Candidatus Gastranaerophilales bacterium]
MSSKENLSKLNTALKYHKNGQLPEAEIIYRQVIEEEPENYNALNLFGILLFQHKRYEEAIIYVEKAIDIHPIPYFYINLGNIHSAKGEFDKAIDFYNESLEMDPNNPDPWFGLGMCYKNKNENDKAIEYYEKAIKLNPSFYSAHVNLGNIYKVKNEFDKAIENYKKAILFNQNDPDIYNSLGLVYFDRYEIEEAIYCFQKAIKIKPNYEKAYINLGNIYKTKGEITQALKYLNLAIEMNPDNYASYISLGNLMIYINKTTDAINCFKIATQLKPNDPAVLLNIGNAYREAHHTETALEYYLKALELMPDKAEVYVNLGNIYSDIYEFEQAIGFYNKAIELKPDYVEAYLNLGSLFITMKNIEDAMNCFQKALEIKPNYAETHLNLGTTYLLMKDFTNGFKHYEWRDKVKDIKHPKYTEFQMPKWDGSPLEGKTLLVCHEQGLGDTLQFVRYLPQLVSNGGKVLFKAPSGMEKLLKQNDLKAEIIDSFTPENQIEFDCYTYLLNIPSYLNSTYDNIPLAEGYLKADSEKVNTYKEKYFNNDSFKIGIKWQGNPNGNKNREIPLELFLKLADIKNVKLYSFQKGYGTEGLKKVPKNIEIVDLGSTFNDFSDTAAAIENLDLLISNDTSLTHLSGALAKKTWILLPFISEWRWFLDSEDSPWYKSVRLFRQKEMDNWQEVMDRVIEELNKINK